MDREHIDPITCDVIPRDRLVHIEEGNYYFDVETLYKCYLENGKYENPFTRLPLPPRVNREVRMYAEFQKVMIYVQGYNTLYFDRFEPLGNIIISLDRFCAENDRFITDKQFYISIDDSDDRLLYDEDLSVEIGSLCDNNNKKITLKIVKGKYARSSLLNVYNWMRSNNEDELTHIISDTLAYELSLDEEYRNVTTYRRNKRARRLSF